MTTNLGASTSSVDLTPLQSLLREAIFSVDRILSGTGMPYFLAYGTALGAEREGDLIPWDFDADLYIRRSDVTAVLAALSSGFEGTEFTVLTPGTSSRLRVPLPASGASRRARHIVPRGSLPA